MDHDIARLGNGYDEELSEKELDKIEELYHRVQTKRLELVNATQDNKCFCDYETCRRYLVARQWDLAKAESQLKSTLTWRLEESPSRLKFWQSPKALNDPYSLSMRIIGWDIEGRPIAYTCFAESSDRWDVEANAQHMMLLMEASCQLLAQRRDQGFNRTASSRQWTWVVDFDGFSVKDTNPKSASVTAKLLQHYPEMLHLGILIDAPKLFEAVFKLIRPFLDERVQAKILFQDSRQATETLQQRLGQEATEWILAETRDNLEKRQANKGTKNKKRYWLPPKTKSEHDPRGMPEYVKSSFYIKTPGDAFLETHPDNA